MRYVLFTTATCPKCPAMKSFVAENIKFEGEVLDNNSENFGERIAEAGVQNAPTIVIYEDGGQEVFRTDEVDQLDEWLKKAS